MLVISCHKLHMPRCLYEWHFVIKGIKHLVSYTLHVLDLYRVAQFTYF